MVTMLKSISLKNYTTFLQETIFDFSATNYKVLEKTNVGRNRILKGALFIGENASGKTQVLKAIVFLLKLMSSNANINFASKKSLYTKENHYQLKYVFDIDEKIIQYELDINKDHINNERFYIDNQLIVDRIESKGTIELNDNKKTITDIDEKLSLVRQEFYNTRFNNNETIQKWFEFISNSIYIDCSNKELNYSSMGNTGDFILAKFINKHDFSKVNKIINEIGYNHELIRTENKNALDDKKYELGFKKKNTNVIIPEKYESTGNIAFANISIPLIYASKFHGMLIIDEFSSGLHNALEEALIKYYFNNSSKNSQLFFTTHSTNILDNYIIRPDQVYTFKFDSKKGTIINRVSNEKPRESQNLEKMYLNGVFDGMPTYSNEVQN